MEEQQLSLRKTAEVVIVAPGRLKDVRERRVPVLSQCRYIVMDEADKLLSPEFSPVMEQLLSYLPEERQVMLFSATFPLIVKDFKVCCR